MCLVLLSASLKVIFEDLDTFMVTYISCSIYAIEIILMNLAIEHNQH